MGRVAMRNEVNRQLCIKCVTCFMCFFHIDGEKE
jgi:hypothetical protein